MLAQTLRAYPGPLSLAALVAGVALLATGSLPLGVVGIALLVAAFLVPFLRLAVLPREARGSGQARPTGSAVVGPTRLRQHADAQPDRRPG
ncbi:MAG: hypothetical protein H0U10_17425 [Chloroflexia bacterium]|nr:hypothetical protein [Chloroflexia bacterium]